MRALIYPIIVGFVTWGAVQVKIWIEGRMEEKRAQKNHKPKQSATYDRNDDDNSPA